MARSRFYLRAKSSRSIADATLRAFIDEVCDPSRVYYIFQPLDSNRRLVLHKEKHGAHQALSSTASQFDLESLYRIVTHQKPQSIVEVGSNNFVATAYMVAAMREGQVFVTAPHTENDKIFYANTSSHVGVSRLTSVDNLPKQVDILYAHATLAPAYEQKIFQQIIQHNGPRICIVENIRQNADTLATWEEIKQQNPTYSSIELRDRGILINHKAASKPQHVTIQINGIKKWNKLF